MGLRCVVMQDTVTSNRELLEQLLDWFAQDGGGDVWYFGKDLSDYRTG
jgi:hypothetical protein